jgi:hypothetical protein
VSPARKLVTLRKMLTRLEARTTNPAPATAAKMLNAMHCERKALEWALAMLDPQPSEPALAPEVNGERVGDELVG